MPKIRKIKLEDRKDMRGGGYARRKFTTEEVVQSMQHVQRK